MGKITGFLEFQRLSEAAEPPTERVASLPRVRRASLRRRGEAAGRALHGLRHPVLPDRLSGQQHHSRLERPRLSRRLEARDRRPALDEQLSRVHRPRLPSAVRGRVRAEHQRRSGRHQVDRARDRRIVRGSSGYVAPQPPATRTGKSRRGRRLGSGGAGLRAAARARRPRRDGVREVRPHRRAAALRHPRLQDGEVAHRSAHRADDRGRRDVPHRRARRRRRRRRPVDRRAARRVRRDRARRRRRDAARPAGARPRAEGRPLRDGVPAAAEQGRRRRPRRRGRSARAASTSS